MGQIWDLGRFESNTAIADEYGNFLTYGQLNVEAEKIARQIGRRCLVFSLCRNEIGSVVGYVSFMNHQIVPVLLNSHMEEELLKNLLAAYEPSYLWDMRFWKLDTEGNIPSMKIWGFSLRHLAQQALQSLCGSPMGMY